MLVNVGRGVGLRGPRCGDFVGEQGYLFGVAARSKRQGLSLAEGVEMKVVSETLGHARSSFTADV